MLPGIKHTIKKPEGSYFLTLTVVGWVDIFTRERYAKIIVDALSYCSQHKGLNVYAYVVMSNHLHLVANCDDGFELNDVIRDFKKFSSKKIVASIKDEPESRRDWMLSILSKEAQEHTKRHQYKVWQDGNFAIELYTEHFTWVRINYIHMNPVRAGYVNRPEHWKYSSAANYLDMDAVLSNVSLLSVPLNMKLH
jgi:putative transposase